MGLLRAAGRTAVIAGTATAVSGRVAHRQEEKWAQQDAAPTAPASAEPATGAGDEMSEQLQNLAALHSQGILSDEEFAAAKAKILGI